MYNEKLRPQFHFTAKEGWLNDPNGLVYYDGQYHLFFQHNPFGTGWGNMTWGHAVSTDLLHWEQQSNALEPDSMGVMFSGSAVVDWNNTAGVQVGNHKTLVALYTAEGSYVDPKQPSTQCLAYSTDAGQNWIKYAHNPVINEITPGNRDPKVFRWVSPENKEEYWVMALYVNENSNHTVQFFRSDNLTEWEFLSKVDGFFECPDCFPLAVDNDQNNIKWVLFGANYRYVTGDFNGREFILESGLHCGDFGPNFYAAQTYSDIPESDNRRIIVGWMQGGNYPDMPFNQQMTFPCELTLRKTANGIRMYKYPVKEIETLRIKTHNSTNNLNGDLFDIEAEIEPGNSTEFGFDFSGYKISYVVGDQILFSGKNSAPLALENGAVKLRILIDRASVEIFANGGIIAISSCFIPNMAASKMSFYSFGGDIKLRSFNIHELKSTWEK